MADRLVRFLPTFFADLDLQLPTGRTSAGTPSTMDFLLFEGRTTAVAGAADVRLFASGGVLVRAVALYAVASAGGDVDVDARMDRILRNLCRS